MNKKLLILLFCITLITTTFLVINYIKNNKNDNYQEIENENDQEEEEEDFLVAAKNNQKNSYWQKIILTLIIFVIVIALIFVIYLRKKVIRRKKKNKEEDLNNTDQSIPIENNKEKKFNIEAKEKINLTDKNIRRKITDNHKEYSIENNFQCKYTDLVKVLCFNSPNSTFLCYNVNTSELIFAEYKKLKQDSFYFQYSNNQIQLDDNYLLLFALLPIENHFSFVWENIEYRKFVQEKLRQLSIICYIPDNSLKDIINEACEQNHPFRLLTEFDQFSYSPSNPNTDFFQFITPKKPIKPIENFEKPKESKESTLDLLEECLNNGEIDVIFTYANDIIKKYYNKKDIDQKMPCFEDNSTVPFKNLIVLLGIFQKIYSLFDNFYEKYFHQLTNTNYQRILRNKKEALDLFDAAYHNLTSAKYRLPELLMH